MSKRIITPKPKRGDTIKLVVKANELVEAKYMFDAWETRFFYSLLAIIDRNDAPNKVYRVYYCDIIKNFELTSNQSYDLLRKAARSLHRKPVYVGWMNDKYRRGREYSMFNFVDYLEAGQEGVNIMEQEYIDIKIQEDVKPFLLHIKQKFDPFATRYTSYELQNIKKLRPYAVRIYELMKQFEYKGSRTISVQDLKEMFLITKEYARFSAFYQGVIQPSIKAINEHTDLYINPDKIERIKKGRRIVALTFPIQAKDRAEVARIHGIELADIPTSYTRQLFDQYQAVVVGQFGVTPNVFARELDYGYYDEQAIEQAIRVTKRAKNRREIKRNVAGFFLKALREGYTDPKEEQLKAKREKHQVIEDVEEALAKLKEEFWQKINEKIRNITHENEQVTLDAIKAIEANPLTEAIIRQKEKKFDRSLTLKDYRQDANLRSMVINSIIQTQGEHFEDILKKYNPKISQLEEELKALKSS